VPGRSIRLHIAGWSARPVSFARARKFREGSRACRIALRTRCSKTGRVGRRRNEEAYSEVIDLRPGIRSENVLTQLS
jgi:hypothetical protein